MIPPWKIWRADPDPTVSTAYVYTTGEKKPRDMVDGDRKTREHRFSPLLRAMDVIPIRENWSWNKGNEAFMDNVRYEYESDLYAYYLNLHVYSLEECMMRWGDMKDCSYSDYLTGMEMIMIKQYKRYIKAFPRLNEKNSNLRKDWWQVFRMMTPTFRVYYSPRFPSPGKPRETWSCLWPQHRMGWLDTLQGCYKVPEMCRDEDLIPPLMRD